MPTAGVAPPRRGARLGPTRSDAPGRRSRPDPVAPILAAFRVGTSEMVDMLPEFGEVSPIDESPDAVRACRALQRHPRQGGRLSDALPPGQDQVIIAFDVLEHLHDDAALDGRPPGPPARRLPGRHRAGLRVPAGPPRPARRALSQLHPPTAAPASRGGRLHGRAAHLLQHLALPGGRGGARPSPCSGVGRGAATIGPHDARVKAVLRRLSASEASVLAVCPLPVGVSIVAVAGKLRP